MAYVVTQPCCADASCTLACPVNCIHPAPGEPGFGETEMVFIDPGSCVGCGACVTACPVGAIVPERSLRPEQQRFAQLNADFYQTFPYADREPMLPVPAQRRLANPTPARVAVIGAGPAGMYTADELLRHPEVEVDVYDRLPTPYGLARAGVAPDHQGTRGITDLFRAIEQQPGFRYVLGVDVGRDVTADELATHYDAIVHSSGAANDRTWDVPGADLDGCVGATDLVGWGNSHPDRAHLEVSLDHPRAVVVGNGNVALDVARLLTLDPAVLAETDVDARALETLRDSQVQEVIVLGRRGPADAAFTLSELIGLAELPGVDIVLDTGGLPLHSGPTHTATSQLLSELSARRPRMAAKRIVLRFGATPVALIEEPTTHRVGAIKIRRTGAETDAGTTGGDPGFEIIEAGLVVRAIGFEVRPVPGLPFDDQTGRVPHERGRVRPGTYVAGWLKRGPRGHLGSNKTCAEETVDSILDDLDAGLIGHQASLAGQPGTATSLASRRRRLAELLRNKTPHAIDLAGWQAIDRAEREQGSAAGRIRSRSTDLEQMRRVAGGVRTLA